MPSRQDQLHSYQFMIQRVVSALVMRETDPARSPFRRLAGAALIGTLLAALGFGGAAAYAIIRPTASDQWRVADSVIVEKETGAIYVYEQGRLHPVLNYPSARLILGRPDAGSTTVSRAAIAGAPKGEPWGIEGAPASLPAPKNLEKGVWTVCSDAAKSALFVGAAPTGTRLLDKALLVRTADGPLYVLQKEHRHLVPDEHAVLGALGWVGRPQTQVSAALINAIPVGRDFAPPVVPALGNRIDAPAGARVGDLFHLANGGYFLATTDGVKAVTDLQAKLLSNDPDRAAALGGGAVKDISPDALTAANGGRQPTPLDVDDTLPEGLTETVPALLEARSGAICGGPRIDLNVTLPDLSAAVAPLTGPTQTVLANHIVVPGGGGAVVVAVGSPNATPAGFSLVTDTGRRYPVPSTDALDALGYQGVQPVRLPAAMLTLLPAGPALDPAGARKPAG
jgi:type VII secretion protein EccB